MSGSGKCKDNLNVLCALWSCYEKSRKKLGAAEKKSSKSLGAAEKNQAKS